MTEDKMELQQRHMQTQLFQQQIEQVQKQLEIMEQQLVELHTIKGALGDIKNTKVGTEILVPLSSGIFLKAELKDNKNVTVNVGSNVATEKTFEQAEELIDTQITEITKVKDQLAEDAGKLNLQAASMKMQG